MTKLRLLVAIASYGTSNDRYLARLIEEYRSMSLDVDIVVLSNIPKGLESDVEMIVGLPYGDPWTLPFPHKQIFADRMDDYDLFLYSEDDVLVTEKNIHAFLRAAQSLKDDEIPGFLRFEEGPEDRNYPEIHGHFHWDPSSLQKRDGSAWAFFTCEHSACYLLTREQLRRAIDSGGYLVGPHQGKYDLLCTAATDPYTQCGLRKLLCVSAIDDFLVHHLPNKYVGTRFGIGEADFRAQINALLALAETPEGTARSLFPTETRLGAASYSRGYYDQPPQELSSMIPPTVKTVLSVGCGWGATEAWLAERGFAVTALPIDPVIPTRARAAGVEILPSDIEAARREIGDRRFDCLLLLNVLHLVEDPVDFLSSLRNLLSHGSIVISMQPNMARPGKPWRKSAHRVRLRDITYQTAGIHFCSPRTVASWFQAAGARIRKTVHIIPPSGRRISARTFGVTDRVFCTDFLYLAESR